MIELNSVSFHQFKKNEQEELTINYGKESQLSANSELLVEGIYHSFVKSATGYGRFLEDSEFHQWLIKYRTGDLSLHEFSKVSANRLLQEIIKYPFADEGTFVFSKYRNLANEYLMIGLVSLKAGLTIDADLTPTTTNYVDIDKVNLAAVINLSELESNEDSTRYLSFIKGRIGRKVSDFFFDFLGAESGLNTKQQNSILIQCVNDFCADVEKEDVNQFKKQVFDYCIDQVKSGEDIQIKELSSELPPNSDGFTFINFTQENGYEIEDSFPVDRPTVKKLTKFVGAGGGLNITFDAQLLNERILYDAETDTLTIKGTPPNLKDQLIRNH